MTIPRSEYPRPQFERKEWVNLNGPWSFELDPGKSGRDRELHRSNGFGREILVPFCPESRLSGVAHLDFIDALWYHRTITCPPSWSGKRVMVHFGAVDYFCEAFVDGVSVGRHWGGSSSFAFDITSAVRPGATHHLVLAVEDDVRSRMQPGGKQCPDYHSRGCHYTRTTGIWQTVRLEAVDPSGLLDVRVTADSRAGEFSFFPIFRSLSRETTFTVTLSAAGRDVAAVTKRPAPGSPVVVALDAPRLWSPGDPFLYDIEYRVETGGRVVDRVTSYAGLRTVTIEGNQVLLNDRPIYQRLVLDQGFYPDGIWTAPSDADLKRDIELSMSAGFNGARLHQKVFEERFHYWADRLGYLTWGESPSWGLDLTSLEAARNFLGEWREIVVRDRNHPSIIAWSPFNETRGGAESKEHGRLHRDAARFTRELDPTRPVNDSSGYVHYETDLYTVHHYEQDPSKLAAALDPAHEGGVFRNVPEHDEPYTGQPYLVDEFGGIKWDPATQTTTQDAKRRASWGYGSPPTDIEDFYARLEGLVGVILRRKHINGYCYTQLTDVEQEQNGVYFYDRSTKFDMKRIRKIFERDPDWFA